MWVWSDSRTTAALTIDIPCTIINDGKIIGKGGQGGSGIRVKNLQHTQQQVLITLAITQQI